MYAVLVLFPFLGLTFGFYPQVAFRRSSWRLFGADEDEPAVRLAKAVRSSVALVLPKGVRNMTARGSGFCVEYPSSQNSTYLITAAHVAAPGFDVQVILNNQTAAATVVGRNVTLDLALLQTTPAIAGVRSLEIASEFPLVGTTTFALGYPAMNLLEGPAVTRGIVCGIANGFALPDSETLPTSTSFVVTDAGMSGGMSGGPLIDSTGTVVGVNALIRPDLRALGNYAVSSKELKSFLDSTQLSTSNGSSDKIAYRVVLFNDPMNKKERVASVLQTTARLNETTANQVMMQAHKTGRGVVAELEGNVAEALCLALRKQDVLVEVERS